MESKDNRGRLVLLGISGILIAFGVVLYSGSNPFSFLGGNHEITVGRGTMIITMKTNLGETTTTQISLSEHVAGKYPIGGQMYLSFPIANTVNAQTFRVTKFTIETPGFKVLRTEPSLPMMAPAQGSQELKIYIETPGSRYQGSLDYTLYIEAIF